VDAVGEIDWGIRAGMSGFACMRREMRRVIAVKAEEAVYSWLQQGQCVRVTAALDLLKSADQPLVACRVFDILRVIGLD
jgi:hypothetical protein